MRCEEPSNWHTLHPLFVLLNFLFELGLRQSRFVGVDSDVWHVGNQGVFFYYGADGISEILDLPILGRSDKAAHARLTLQQGLVRFLHRGVVFVWKENSELAEIHLAHGKQALLVARRIELVEELLGLDGIVNVYH